MMNPQYPPPGQNNNAPVNPLYPPSSQEYNGVQNANIYGQMPPNGPQKPHDPADMPQKMQNMNLNGPQGFPTIPSAQLPPGQQPNFPPSNFPQGQMPPGSFPPGRPPVSGAPQMQRPPQSSTPGPQFQMPPASQTPDQNRQFPPSPNQSGPMPSGAPGHQGPPGQMPPSSQPGLPPQGLGGRPGGPPQPPRPGMPSPGQQPGFPSQPGMPPQQGMPPQPGQNPQSRMPSQPGQPGMPPSSMQNQMPQAGQPGFPPGQMPSQPRLPPQPGMPLQPGQIPGQSGMPPQLGQMPGQPGQLQQLGKMPGQPGMHPQPGQMPGQPGMPPQPGQMPGQPGMPLQPGQMPGQPGMPPQSGQMPGQPGMPPQPGHMPGQPGMPPQPGQMPGQPGMPPQPGQMPGQPGMPPQPGQMPGQRSLPGQQGLPPQPGQPGMPPHPGMQQPGMQQPGMPPHPGQMQGQGMPPSSQAYNQSMPGLPHMPPPLGQQNQYPGIVQQQPGIQKQPGPPTSGYPGMPPMPNQQAGYGPPSSGYPPQYNQPPFPSQQPSYPNQQYQQQQKRLDPDQMPSPIQVMADDQANRGGVFVTNDKGLVPPLVTTDFVVDDKGNASPRYIRSSMYAVPVTQDLLKQTSMPFCLVISPMAEVEQGEQEPPLLDFAALTGSPALGPVRCARCKAYMCPNMKFIDAGRHFKCAFCKATTEVPMEYTQYINSMQQYGRVPAEMALGAYEILATKEYCRNNTMPNPPAIVFVLDVSYNAVKSGLVHTVCNNIMHIIDSMPRDEQGHSWTRVGFITYSSTVHFYNIKGSLAQPQMLSVGDVGDMFVPLLEGFLVTADDSGPVLQQLLQQLPTMFQENKETETILLPAVQAGLEALKAADTSGQLLVFHTSLPSLPAPGKLLNREDRKLLGTDKEKNVLCPANTAYNEVGQACSAAGVSVELFVCNNSYVDAATIGQLPRLTGGQIHKYTYFSAEVDGPRLIADAVRVASRPTAHDAVMRVRTSTGVRATDFIGHLFMSNTTDVELAAIDADKAIGVEIKHDDKLTAEDGVYIQTALLYTHRSGQRRLRILNLALALANQLADAYRAMEQDTAVNFLTKQAVWALREHPPRQIREGLSARCARTLAAYRRHCASPSSAGQLVLPESMKLLPLYTACMLRSDALAGGPDLTCDDRSCAMYRALTADVVTSVVYTYPRLLPLHRLPETPPQPLRASIDKMNDHGVYLLENGVHMLIWVGGAVSPEFVQDVFGVAAPHLVDTQVCELPELDNPTSHAVRAVVDEARRKRHTAMRVTVMRQHDKLEAVLRQFLVEDRGLDGAASYVDFLCHVHKEIRALL